jgi:hypothetical protein
MEAVSMKTLCLIALCFVFVPAIYAVGALARNPRNNDGTVVVNKASKDAAIHDATLACGTDCEIVITFQNSCVAYAADHKANSTVYGYGQAGDKDTAGERALDQCQSRGGSCTVMDSGCDGN